MTLAIQAETGERQKYSMLVVILPVLSFPGVLTDKMITYTL